MPPTFAPGAITQYNTDFRSCTSAAMSALKVMFMEPAMSIRPSKGRFASAAIRDRAPSAPIRYRARMV